MTRKLRHIPAKIAGTSHRGAVGGMWDEIGRLQFHFLQAEGLRPHHRLLDIGCGSLRGGVHFARYLHKGNYFGIDANPRLITAGQKELAAAGIPDRATLRVSDDFNMDFGVPFDFALAHSLFTHLPFNSIQLCLIKIDNILAPGAKLFATFFRNPAGVRGFEPAVQPGRDGDRLTFMHRDPYHYDPSIFSWLCESLDLTMEDLGNWNHPRSQQMLRFTKTRSHS